MNEIINEFSGPILIMYKRIGDKKTIESSISMESLQNIHALHGESFVKDALYNMFINLKDEKYN